MSLQSFTGQFTVVIEKKQAPNYENLLLTALSFFVYRLFVCTCMNKVKQEQSKEFDDLFQLLKLLNDTSCMIRLYPHTDYELFFNLQTVTF